MSYFKDTIKGLSWIGGLRGLTRIITIVKIVILARLLDPIQFGIFGIASLVLAFLEIIFETGINVFLIQDEGKIEDYLDTAWVVSIIRGIIISLTIIILTPLISSFFNSLESRRLLLLISVVPFIKGFINPSVVKFMKNLDFKKEFVFRFAIFAFDTLVSILVALVTKSAISIVWGILAGALLEVTLSFFVLPKPRFIFEKLKIKKVVNRGKWVTLYGIFNYAFEHGDDIVVGKLLGSGLLGLYQVAYRISTLPLSEVSESFIKVTFPLYVRIHDNKTLKTTLYKSILLISLIVIPLGTIIFLFPKEIIILLLGEKWVEAGSILKILAVFGIIRAINHPIYALFLALKKQEFVTYSTLISAFVMAVAIYPLTLAFGLRGSAIAALTGTLAVIPFTLLFMLRIFKKVK